MTRIPFDQLAKQYLEAFLEPLGNVQRNLEVPGEPKFIDIWFTPASSNPAAAEDLGLLTRMATTPCLLEPFRSPPSRQEVRTCLLKLLWMHEEQRRQSIQEGRQFADLEQPRLWILAATTSQPVIDDFGGQVQPEWGAGVYFLPKALKTAIAVIDRLPVTAATLWLRILGRDQVQAQAIAELLALPWDDSRRVKALQLLVSWRVTVEMSSLELDTREEQLMVTLSQAYLEWEQRTEQRGEQRGRQEGRQEEARSLVLRLLNQKFEALPERLSESINTLNLEQLESLAIALLNFASVTDLEHWLADQENHSDAQA